MKKSVLFLFVVFASLNSIGQTQDNINKIASGDLVLTCNKTAVYKLFPTDNIWILIKLNTQNGKMWLVQFDVSGNDRFETFLNMNPLAAGADQVTGRFTLYPTDNMYNFILLDQIDGRVWQTQWSTDPSERIILPIE